MKLSNKHNLYCISYNWWLVLFLFSTAEVCTGQSLDVTFNPSLYNGGYNISCNGSNDGSLEAIIVGGQPPYSFQWSTGAYTKTISGLPAGTYTIFITDAAQDTISKSYTLIASEALTGSLKKSTYGGGYNVSAQGASDGWITAVIGGGAMPYSYQWSNGAESETNHDLSSGSYSVIVRDVNQCQLQLSANLTQPTPLHIVSITSPLHNGYNLSCKGSEDGAIDLTVSGGVSPYTYQWSNGNFTQDLADLKAGEYTVLVKDLNGVGVTATITLTQPDPLEVNLTAPTYPNGHHTTCYNCSNGSVTTTVTGGVMPYTYSWNTGQSTQNLANLMAGTYAVQVTDANGCTKTDIKIDLTQPDRDDWTLKGNIINGLDSVFIGTVDSSEFSIRTFNQSRINVMPNGDVEIAENLVVKALYSESTIGFGNQNFLASRAQDSIFPEIISYGRLPSVLPLSLPYCNAPILNANPINQFNGHLQLYGNSSVGGSLGVMDIGFDGVNAFIESTGSSPDPNSNRLLLNYYCGKDVFVGNSTSGDFTANRDLFVNGRIGIGTRNITNCADCSSYSLFVKGGIRAERIKLDIASNNGWADYVFDKQYHLMEIHELKEYIKHNKHLPGVPSQEEVKVNGIDVAEMNKILLSKIEELTLYIIELNSDLESIKKRK